MNIEGMRLDALYVPEASYDVMSSWRREHRGRPRVMKPRVCYKRNTLGGTL